MIVGAGLAGLLAAHMFPREPVCDVGPPVARHRALLRFRSDAVSLVTGIPFRRVRVHKGIWWDGAFRAPTIQIANMYALKCLGKLVGDRSIWNIDAADRWVAPDSFYEQLVEHTGQRITWNTMSNFKDDAHYWISTAPMHATLAAVGIESPETFHRQPIAVRRFKVRGADVFQTIYFPNPEHSLYRASITGDTLICEFIDDLDMGWEDELWEAFNLRDVEDMVDEPIYRQHYGKIAPINEPLRRMHIATLTNDFNIFSLGRFATWRNLLLDDVVSDANVVRRLLTATTYERKLSQHKE